MIQSVLPYQDNNPGVGLYDVQDTAVKHIRHNSINHALMPAPPNGEDSATMNHTLSLTEYLLITDSSFLVLNKPA